MQHYTPFLLLPGLLGSPRLYQEQIISLWKLGPVFIANTSLDDSIEEITRRILSSAPHRFILIGLSMGGYVAFEIMRQAPERVEGLVLLDTTAREDSEETIVTRNHVIDKVNEGGFTEVIEKAYSSGVHPSRTGDNKLKEIVFSMAQDVGADGFIRQLRAIIERPDSRNTLHRIQCKTLILVGDSDLITPVECAEEIVHRVANAELKIIPNCGHISTLEQPELTNRAINDWLHNK